MENAAELEAAAALSLTEQEKDLLGSAQRIADEVLEPNAQAVDRSGEPPAGNLRALADAGLVSVTTPVEWGGVAASGAFMREYTETLTAACGTTWFVLTQHLGACGMLAGSSNPTLRERYLHDMAAGRHYVGVGFGHLRRPEPMLRANPVEAGWVLSGVAPWVTGWPLLSGVVYGAVLPDDRHLFVYVPAAESDGLSASPPLPLCAMNASATVEVRMDDVFVPEGAFVKYSSREEMARGDTAGIAGAIYPPLGCARGSLSWLRQIAERRRYFPAITETADALDAEINACRAEAQRWSDGPKDIPEYKPGALNARTWAIELGVRAAHMAVAASSGAANSLDHPAQRRFREAMFYTLIAQTTDIMSATLERLRR
jgi:alkylation response protein AidB-like acyl-CoA dehydrogenase